MARTVIKLCDYLMMDALRLMMMSTVTDLLSFVVPAPEAADAASAVDKDDPMEQSSKVCVLRRSCSCVG